MSKEGTNAKTWWIKEGSGGKSDAANVMDSFRYILNGEKVCVSTKDGQVNPVIPGKAQFGKLMDTELKYVTRDIKTINGALTGCRRLAYLSGTEKPCYRRKCR